MSKTKTNQRARRPGAATLRKFTQIIIEHDAEDLQEIEQFAGAILLIHKIPDDGGLAAVHTLARTIKDRAEDLQSRGRQARAMVA